MSSDEKDLQAMQVFREIMADPHKDIALTTFKLTWTVRINHEFYASGRDLATVVLEAHAKSHPQAQKRCSGCIYSGYRENDPRYPQHKYRQSDPNLRCRHTDSRGAYVNDALGFGKPCGPSYSNFEQREDTHLNGDPKASAQPTSP